MRKLSFYFLLAFFAASILISCEKDEIELNPAEGKTVTVDATSYDEWTYFSFSLGDIVTVSNPATDTNWDLAFMRNHIRTNSGASGEGQGGVYDAGVVGFETVTEAPPAGYVVDVDTVQHSVMDFTQNPPSVVLIDINASAVLETWGAFDMTTSPPPFNVTDKIFAVKTADGKFAKIHVQSYYNSDGSGYITFEYKYQADGTANLE